MAGHNTNIGTTGTTGTTTSSSAPRVTTAGTGAGTTLNYALDFRTLDRSVSYTHLTLPTTPYV